MTDYAAKSFDTFFQEATGKPGPFDYQRRLAEGESGADNPCVSRLIDVPTGCGKTAAVVLAWLWNRVMHPDATHRATWPRRLVFTLPMRVLVEQTEAAIREWLNEAGLFWTSGESHAGKVGLHVLMGGVEANDWHLYPEENAILLGTQDMLLSRAMNRGYGAFRARWPVDFGLLNQDSLWVFDEVQLFDVGLATSGQLHAFRREDAANDLFPCHSWWMSATLRPAWLDSVDFHPYLSALTESIVSMHASEQTGTLWQAAKPCQVETIPQAEDADCRRWAKLVADLHTAATETEWGRVTLVIANTVKRATALFDALEKLFHKSNPKQEIRLVHSRFRGEERAKWREAFLTRDACQPGANRILVATQVIEAGVDLSASVLVTELAPWPSLVQRFGRAARYGGAAQVLVVDRVLADRCKPYEQDQLLAAREALDRLDDVSLPALGEFRRELEASAPELAGRLFPYKPAHLLTRRELDELFDTTPDLTGADLDISRFIRSGEERDVSVFWREIPDDNAPLSAKLQPSREELCLVPFLDARDWLCQPKSERRHDGCQAWVWDVLKDEWRPCTRSDLFPGRTVLVDLRWGGYDPSRGFTGEKLARGASPLFLPTPAIVDAETSADAALKRDDLSLFPYKTIASHSADVAIEIQKLLSSIGLGGTFADLFDLAARLHDWGKAHPVFQKAITEKKGYSKRQDLAKAPRDAWKRGYERPGFRHELASTLAVLEILRRIDPLHPALLGPYRELLAAIGETVPDTEPFEPNTLLDGLRALDADSLNLLLYLVCAHHGKVRGAWHADPFDQEAMTKNNGTVFLRGVRENDELPPIEFLPKEGTPPTMLPSTILHLDPATLGLSTRYGASWSERVLSLLKTHGPFRLAYLETLFRCADVRASKLDKPDPLLTPTP